MSRRLRQQCDSIWCVPTMRRTSPPLFTFPVDITSTRWPGSHSLFAGRAEQSITMKFTMSMSSLIVALLLVASAVGPSECFFLWPKLSSFSSPSTSSSDHQVTSIHTRPDYQYNWNIYQQSHTPSVLFPQLRQHQPHHFPSTPTSGWLGGLFKKPWLAWKWNKLGKLYFDRCNSNSHCSFPQVSRG